MFYFQMIDVHVFNSFNQDNYISTKSTTVSFIHPYPFLITVYEKGVLQEATGANNKQDIDSIQSKEQFYINLTI